MDDSYQEFYGKIEETDNRINTSGHEALVTPHDPDANSRKGLSNGRYS